MDRQYIIMGTTLSRRAKNSLRGVLLREPPQKASWNI